MKIRRNQQGFAAPEAVIIAIVLVVIGFVGYRVYSWQQKNHSAKTAQNQSEQSSVATDVPSPPAINDTADLDKAEAVLDQTDPGGSNVTDQNRLNAELQAF